MQRIHDPQERGFASDNYSGVHPEVLAAIAAGAVVVAALTTVATTTRIRPEEIRVE